MLLLTGWVIWQYASAPERPRPQRAAATSAAAKTSDVAPRREVSPDAAETDVPTATMPDIDARAPQATHVPTPRIEYLPDHVDPPNPNDRSVAGRLRQYGSAARKRLVPRFRDAGVHYPPAKLLLVGLKQERLLKIYASSGSSGRWRFVCQYPVVASGPSLGPKLREGDRQTPEGIYRITLLNPESSYHLSMAINYPNEFDWRQAKRDKRRKLGCDIMIHGFWLSDGCLAMGDTAATDLFVLAADTGLRNAEVLLSPVDFRVENAPEMPDLPPWTAALYADIRARLAQLDDGVSTQAKVIRYRDTLPPQELKAPQATGSLSKPAKRG